ncbi:UNVERIFIED_CONTAM: Furcatin hydrolase, partial [Sesamum latifolium]
EDVKLVKYIGFDVFKMSISWPRILPRIIPFVTLFHWDLPQALEDEYGGFLKPDIMFINPLVHGNYPRIMQSLIGNRLPKFTKEQAAMLKGSFDFLGLNYYTGNYASHICSSNRSISSTTDNMVCLSTRDINNVSIGEPTGISAFFIYPKGLYKLLVYTKKKYKNPTIYITETGMADLSNGTMKHTIEDLQRIKFYYGHFRAVQEAITQGVNVKGLFAWSFLDTFEWGSGYSTRFGLYYVDYKNGLKRVLKQSAIWFKNCLSNKCKRSSSCHYRYCCRNNNYS